MKSKLLLGVLALSALLVLAGAGSLSGHDALRIVAGQPYAPPSAALPLGSDLMGRDVLGRLISATGFELLRASAVIALALAFGIPLGLAARTAPSAVGGPVRVLAYICFVAPRQLLSPTWPSRILMAVCCFWRIFPFVLVVADLMAIFLGGFGSGWGSIIAAGTYLAVAVAYMVGRLDRKVGDALPGPGAGFRQLAGTILATATSLLPWAICSQRGFDVMGQGVMLPQASWGAMLGSQREMGMMLMMRESLAGPAAVVGCYVIVGIGCFLIGDALRQWAGSDEAASVSRLAATFQ